MSKRFICGEGEYKIKYYYPVVEMSKTEDVRFWLKHHKISFTLIHKHIVVDTRLGITVKGKMAIRRYLKQIENKEGE